VFSLQKQLNDLKGIIEGLKNPTSSGCVREVATSHNDSTVVHSSDQAAHVLADISQSATTTLAYNVRMKVDGTWSVVSRKKKIYP